MDTKKILIEIESLLGGALGLIGGFWAFQAICGWSMASVSLRVLELLIFVSLFIYVVLTRQQKVFL